MQTHEQFSSFLLTFLKQEGDVLLQQDNDHPHGALQEKFSSPPSFQICQPVNTYEI